MRIMDKKLFKFKLLQAVILIHNPVVILIRIILLLLNIMVALVILYKLILLLYLIKDKMVLVLVL